MPEIAEKEFTSGDFIHEHLGVTIPDEKNDSDECYQDFWLGRIRGIVEALHISRYFYNRENDPKLKKDYWWQPIQLLPSSYNQTRNVMLNYEVLTTIYKQRHQHKLDEWIVFCDWIVSLPYSELVLIAAGMTQKYIKEKMDARKLSSDEE